MANNEKIDYLITDIKELEKLVTGMKGAEVYPVSFFSRTFDLAHKILNDLHWFETEQIEALREQMEAHQALIQDLPPSIPKQHPELEYIREEKEKVGALVDEIVKEPETPVKKETPPPAVMIGEKSSTSLYDMIERRNLVDFRKAFSLNDWFYFRRELFLGDEAKMSKVVSDLSSYQTYEESVAYLNEKLNLNPEDAIVTEFIQLLEKRFS